MSRMSPQSYNRLVMIAMESMLARFQTGHSMDTKTHDMQVSVNVGAACVFTGDYRRARLEGIAMAVRLWEDNYQLTHALRDGRT